MRVQTEYFINEYMYVTFSLSNVIFKACFRIGWIAFPSTAKKYTQENWFSCYKSSQSWPIVFKLVAFFLSASIEILNLSPWKIYAMDVIYISAHSSLPEDLSHHVLFHSKAFSGGKVQLRGVNFFGSQVIRILRKKEKKGPIFQF